MSSLITPSQLVTALNWRYAVKKFDPARTIAPGDWSALEQSLVLAPSSFGLQPWKFIVVTDPAVKAELVPASWGQAQPVDCSHFVVLACRQGLDDVHVDRYLARMVEVRGPAAAGSAQAFGKVVKQSLDGARAAGRLDAWQSRQVYIALGQFMAAAAVIGVDTCPMEGITPERYDTVLGLAGTGYTTVVACAAGYRAPDDKYATTPKVRFKAEDVVVRI
jgi:nitroreductase